MLVERGLLAPNDTAQLEATIKALQQQMAHVKIDQEAVAKAMQSAQIVHEKGLTDANSARQLYELLAARGAINGAAVDEKAIANAIAAATARMDEAGAALAKSHLTVASGENIMLLPHLEPSAPVQAGDLIRITITGEPDLPAMYRVAEEGTIRLPFVGAIKVAGLNSRASPRGRGQAAGVKEAGVGRSGDRERCPAGDDQAQVTSAYRPCPFICQVRMASIGNSSITMLSVRLSRIMTTIRSSTAMMTATLAQTRRRAASRNPVAHMTMSLSEFSMLSPDIALRNRHGPVAVDDERGVLQDLPDAFEHDRDEEPRAHREAPRHEPEQPVEQEPVQDVRERIRIEHALRLLAAPDVGFQPAEPAVRAQGQPAHPHFDRGRRHHHGEDRKRKTAGTSHRGSSNGERAHRLAMIA